MSFWEEAGSWTCDTHHQVIHWWTHRWACCWVVNPGVGRTLHVWPERVFILLPPPRNRLLLPSCHVMTFSALPWLSALEPAEYEFYKLWAKLNVSSFNVCVCVYMSDTLFLQWRVDSCDYSCSPVSSHSRLFKDMCDNTTDSSRWMQVPPESLRIWTRPAIPMLLLLLSLTQVSSAPYKCLHCLCVIVQSCAQCYPREVRDHEHQEMF